MKNIFYILFLTFIFFVAMYVNLFIYLFFRFYTYKPTSLERSFKYDLLTEHDLGVSIDLINPDTYKIDLNGKRLCMWTKHKNGNIPWS